jgi:hypothetical protein
VVPEALDGGPLGERSKQVHPHSGSRVSGLPLLTT